jgi:hypothetical protein
MHALCRILAKQVNEAELWETARLPLPEQGHLSTTLSCAPCGGLSGYHYTALHRSSMHGYDACSAALVVMLAWSDVFACCGTSGHVDDHIVAD